MYDRIVRVRPGLGLGADPLPDMLARLQGLVMGCLPGKPFTLDNFRSLTRDSICTDDGFARLGLPRRGLMEVLPTYLTPRSTTTALIRRTITTRR